VKPLIPSLFFVLALSVGLSACEVQDGSSLSDNASSGSQSSKSENPSASSESSSSSDRSSSASSSSSPNSSSTSDVVQYVFQLTKEGNGEVDAPVDGLYEEGYPITLSAIADDGYSFSGYYENSILLSSSADYEFALDSDCSVVAVFAADDYQATFSHVFKQANFTTGGGSTDINGLTWSYSAFTYLGGANQGVQIGSKNNPQTSAWTLATTFGTEITVKAYSFELCTASSGSAQYTVAFGDYSKNADFSTTTLTEYSDSELACPSTSFSLSLVATARAMYFYSLSLTISVPADYDLEIYADDLTGTAVVPGVNGIPATSYTVGTKEEYYSGVDLSETGEALVGDLRTLISTMAKQAYGDARYMLQYTDENPDKDGYDYGMWDGDDIYATWDSGASWNREHVWCCAQMKLDGTDPRPGDSDKNHATDLHNLRVACQQSNGFHSDKFFDETNTDTTMYPNITSGLNGHHAFTGDFRGDVARILFYMYVRYEGLVLDDALDGTDIVSMGKLSCLLTWNEEDPVDDFETQRNNRIYEYQGNRNPFIDYPDLTEQIWTA
jgi:endonuclease I